MIELEKFVVDNEDGNQVEPLSASFPYQISEIERKDRMVFDYLSLRFGIYGSGSIKGDNFFVEKEDDFSSLFILKLSIKNYAEMEIVFKIPQGASPYSFKSELGKKLSPLSAMEVKTQEDGETKMAKAFETLSDCEILYLLIDENVEINAQNRRSIHKSILRTNLPCFCLLAKPKESEKKEAPLPKRKKKEATIVIRNNRRPSLNSGFPAYIKEAYPDLLFATVFALFSSVGLYCGIALLEEGNALYGVLSIVVGVVCFFIESSIFVSLAPTYRKYDSKNGDFAIYHVVSITAILVGFGLSFLVFFIMISTSFLFERAYFSSLAAIISFADALAMAAVVLLSSKLNRAFISLAERLGFKKR